MREERDAIGLAFRIAEMTPPEELLRGRDVRGPQDSPLASVFVEEFLRSANMDLEDDLISEDLRRFDGNGVLDLRRSAVARFTDDKFALAIFNTNRRPLEHTQGVDLVYWDQGKNIFTLVQYKRLSSRAGDVLTGRRKAWYYSRREDLVKQLSLMDVGEYSPEDADDWRLSTSQFWFKFLKADSFQGSDPMVLKGMYVSADYLRLALNDGSLTTGPRGGFEVTYENAKYITREPFVDLLRRGMLGTTRHGSSRVLEVMNRLSETDQVITAIKTKRSPRDVSSEFAVDPPF